MAMPPGLHGVQHIWGAGQLTPQPPQSLPDGGVQVPAQQRKPVEQTRPHTPQFIGSVMRLKQPGGAAVAGLGGQQVSAPVQAGMPRQVQLDMAHWLPLVQGGLQLETMH
jgi:hypothetical protein